MDTVVGPQLRAPSGAYRQARTAASASATVLTMGMMTPWAPASSILPMMPGSFQGTRTTGTDPPNKIAWIMGTASEYSIGPCCVSMQT